MLCTHEQGGTAGHMSMHMQAHRHATTHSHLTLHSPMGQGEGVRAKM